MSDRAFAIVMAVLWSALSVFLVWLFWTTRDARISPSLTGETQAALERADAAVMDDVLIRAWHLGYSAGYESAAGECVTLVTHGRQP